MLATSACLAIAALSSGSALGQSPALPGVARAEPSADETIQKALATFAVTSASVGGLRTRARLRGLVPRVSGNYLRDDGDGQLGSQTRGDQNVLRDETSTSLTDTFGASVEWDFRDLAFHPSEVDVYGLVGVQRDLILEVSRTYFLRQQLLIQRVSEPPDSAAARQILDLRIAEFTVLLDAFTEGWFSAETQRRRAQGPSPGVPSR